MDDVIAVANIAVMSSFLHAMLLLVVMTICLGCIYKAYKVHKANRLYNKGRGDVWAELGIDMMDNSRGGVPERGWARDPSELEREFGGSGDSDSDSDSGSGGGGGVGVGQWEKRGLISRTTYGGI